MDIFRFFRKRVEHKSTGSTYFYNSIYNSKDRNFDALANEGYQQNVIVYFAVNKLAQAVAECPLVVVQDGKEMTNHPVLDLLAKPNSTQDWSTFIKNLIGYHQISGNAFIEGLYPDGDVSYKKTPPSELKLRSPRYTSVESGKNNVPAKYKVKRSNGDEYEIPVTILGQSNMMHIKTFNPLDEWMGMSPVMATAFSVDMHNGSSEYGVGLMQNGARPSGALVVNKNDGTPNTLNEAQYSALQEQIDSQIAGSSNSGKPLLLEGGLDWKEMSLSPREMDFIESRNISAREIALAYGIPAPLLGIQGDTTYSNMSEAKLDMWLNTIIPLAETVVGSLNNWLMPRYGGKGKLAINKDKIDALAPLRAEQFERINSADFLTVNEKRTSAGYDTIVGGDSPLIDSNKIPLDMLSIGLDDE